MSTPLLSIIIISYNTKNITKECVESIFKSLEGKNLSCEIIVVDNVSTDGSINMLESLQKEHSQIVLIKNTSNVGFAKANNQAVTKTKGEYLLFLNSDIKVMNNAISDLFDYFRTNENRINFLGGKLLNKDLSPQASCGPFYSLPVIFAALFLRGDYWGLTRSSPNNAKRVDWISGACILTKKKYYEAVNGFDENIFMYMDEIDLLYRAKEKGYLTFFYPKAKFIHYGSASSGNRTYPILQVYKGFLYFYKKHHNGLSMLLLKGMLQFKALISILIGRIISNQYLVTTYGEANKLVKMD